MKRVFTEEDIVYILKEMLIDSGYIVKSAETIIEFTSCEPECNAFFGGMEFDVEFNKEAASPTD